MKHLRYADIKLRTSELTTFNLSVPVWELPLIELVHGRSAVERKGESLRSVQVRKRHRDGSFSFVEIIPTGSSEFERLAKRYRRSQTEDGGVGPAHVDLVYGQFGVGEVNLQRAIDENTVDLPEPAGAVSPQDDSVLDLIGDKVSSVGG